MEESLYNALKTLMDAYHGEGDLKDAMDQAQDIRETYEHYQNIPVHEEFGPEQLRKEMEAEQ